jgi:signal transduction histidine kinase/CheY-like chemotaxis protein
MSSRNEAETLASEYSVSGPIELLSPVPSIAPTFLCGKLKQYFEEHDTESVAVTIDNKPIGFLSYKNIAHHFLSQFGYALFQYRPVLELMTNEFVIADAENDLLTIVEMALKRPPSSIYDDIVITQHGEYLGLVSVARLLLEQNKRISHQVELLEQNKQLLETMNRDLTAAMDNLHHAEIQIIQAEKMAGIGTLAAGIAHDFNNVLNVILTSTQILSMKLPADSPLHKYCASIEQATSRSTGLTRQLLHFSQKNSIVMHEISLNTIASETMKLLGRSLDKSITTIIECEDNLPLVKADETQIQQVILNLSLNARDAMSGRGVLTVKTSAVAIDHDFRSVDGKPFEQGEYVCLSLEDTGTGIPHDLIRKIFDPFFTTKEVGKGSGLGLSVVYGIISKHHGYITVDSAIGIGTKFSIYLKAAAPASTMPTDEPQVAAPPQKTCSGTILMVDDEQLVLQINAELMESFGYTIITADSGRRAVELYRKRHREIDVVLLDMMMPGMDGSQTFHALKQIRQDVKVLFVSGYGEEEKFASALEEGALGVTSKPIDGTALSQSVNQALHAPPAAKEQDAVLCLN